MGPSVSDVAASSVSRHRGTSLAAWGVQRVTLPLVGLIALTGAGLVCGLLLGWWARSNQPASVTVSTGQAYAAPSQISVSAGGWSYDVPLEVPWRTQGGEWQLGSRPACLAPKAATQQIRFGWVRFATRGTTDRRLVWVECP
jgi:hypothetical protein